MSPRAALLALCLLGAPPLARAGGDVRVIVHPANPVSTLTRAEASALFLRKSTRWKDGAVVRPIEPREEAVQRAFCDDVHRKSTGAVRAYWNQQIFSGRAVPPETVAEAQVVAKVATDHAAVGYVSPGAVTGAVKVVSIRD